MTIEIRQLIIRASVQARTEPASSGPSASQWSAQPNEPASTPSGPAVEHDALVAATVREVLRKLERARGR